jgi:hypothetical protein
VLHLLASFRASLENKQLFDCDHLRVACGALGIPNTTKMTKKTLIELLHDHAADAARTVSGL